MAFGGRRWRYVAVSGVAGSHRRFGRVPRLAMIEEAFEVDRGRRDQQLQLDQACAAASRAVCAVAFEFGDGAFGVGLAIDGGAGRSRCASWPVRRRRPRARRPAAAGPARSVDPLQRLVGGLAGVAGVGGQLGDRVTGEPGAVRSARSDIGLRSGRALGGHGDDHPVLGVDGDLAAMNQMRAMPRLVAQLGVRIGPRHRGRVGRDPLRRRPGPRLGQRQRRPRSRNRPAHVLAVASPSPSPSPSPSTSSSSARRLFSAASASICVPSTHNRRPPTKPASVHCLSTGVKSCSNTDESAKRLVCA